MTQRQQKRDRILRAAFEVWGDSNFVSTSLSSIAERLELTKPALYRYFRSKNDLLAGMQQQFAEDYRDAAERAMCWDPAAGLGTIVDSVTETVLAFLRREPAYLAFFTEYLLRQSLMHEKCVLDSVPPLLQHVLARQSEVLSAVIRREYRDVSEELVAEALQHVFLATVYWCALYLMTPDMRPRRREHGDAPGLRRRHLALVCEVVLNGLGSSALLPAERLAAVEEAAWRNPGTVLTEDRVLAAVGQVVGEVGFAEATVERIAEYLGISKSSLYFYFKNKREMFGELIARENELFLEEYERIRARLSELDEQLYAYVVLQTAFFAHNPGAFTALNWLWSQSPEAVELPERYLQQIERQFGFLQEAIEGGRLRSTEDGWMSVVGFFHVGGVMRFAGDRPSRLLDGERRRESARALFTFGMYGVRGVLAQSGQAIPPHGSEGVS